MLHYTTTGTGNTIVILHGIAQSSEAWQETIANEVLATYRKISADLPGHGRSPRSKIAERDYSIKGIAALLKDFLNDITEPYLVVAHSISSNIIAEIIHELPLCKGLMLFAPSVIGAPFSITDIVKPNPHFATTFAPDPMDEAIHDLLLTWSYYPQQTLSFYTQLFKATDPSLRVQIGIAIAQTDWSDEISHLKQLPYHIAIVNGTAEQLVHTDYLNHAQLNLWKNEVQFIESAGHNCQADQPEAVAEFIAAYAHDIFK